MPLSNDEKRDLVAAHMAPLANTIRQIEREAVEGASHRKIEVTALCHHELLNGLLSDLGIPFSDVGVNPSVYGENGGK